MTLKQKNNLLGFALLAFCLVIAIIAVVRKQILKKNHVVGVARVYHYSSGGRGNAGGIWIDYILEVNGKKYTASSLYSTTEIKYEGLREFLNRTFPAIYNPKNPSISSLILLPKDFSNKGIAFPDSLNWILPYLKDPPH